MHDGALPACLRSVGAIALRSARLALLCALASCFVGCAPWVEVKCSNTTDVALWVKLQPPFPRDYTMGGDRRNNRFLFRLEPGEIWEKDAPRKAEVQHPDHVSTVLIVEYQRINPDAGALAPSRRVCADTFVGQLGHQTEVERYAIEFFRGQEGAIDVRVRDGRTGQLLRLIERADP